MYRIYATSTCAACKAAAKYLDEKDLEYEYKLIDRDVEAKNELYSREPHVRMVPWIFEEFDDGDYVVIGSFQSLKERIEGA